MKKIWSIILTLLLVVGSTVTAFADETAKHVITITNEKAGHVYEAYQIFKGDLNASKTILSNVQWGAGIDGASFLAALKEQESYADCESAADVSEVLAGFGDDSENLDAFAQEASKYLTGIAAGRSTEEQSPYTIPVTGDGYYLIMDAETAEDGDAYTKYILQVVKDVEVKAKADAPTLEKKIVDGDSFVDANSVSVGDTVEYLITSRVPEMDGYDKYFFVVHDTLDEGLTFNNTSVEITIGGQTLDADAYIIETEDVEDGCSFEIIFKDFIQYKEQSDAVIEISYQAVVNQKANIGTVGNANKAHLEYSNNPNVEQNGQEGNEDKPGFGDVTGVTPNDVTISYITGIELIKVNDKEVPERLQGAEFRITGEKLNQVKVVKGIFEENENGIYYKLKDGTYTSDIPIAETTDRYEDTDVKYVYSEKEEWMTVTEEVDTTAMVNLNGEVHFHGLAAGTYEIEEITAPNGYNLLDEPIVIEIIMVAPELVETGAEDAEWKYTVSGAMEQEEAAAEDGVVKLSVVNKAGMVLPSTGGSGVYLFYVIGAALAIAAMIADTKKNRKKDMNEI